GRTSKGFTKHFHKLENLAAKKLLEKNIFTQQHTTKKLPEYHQTVYRLSVILFHGKKSIP
uniref:hypothetical protein n=1 Tax=Streptococcus sobrinus TaxID=1310 RepID=UPI0005163B79